MKRLFMAAASYAFYRWWNKRQNPSASMRRSQNR